MMPETPPVPTLHVGVALVRRDDKILLVYNPKWRSFTLPMSKLMAWGGSDDQGNLAAESGVEAAGRAAGEWLSATFEMEPHKMAENIALIQSDRNGVWNNYHFEIFELPLDEDATLVDGAIAEWLTKDEILNPKRHPISPTARHLIAQLRSTNLI